MMCDSPGYSQVSRHWLDPRSHSMTRVMPDSQVTSQPSAHGPMYGYSGVSSHEYTSRARFPGRALPWKADHDGHEMTAPVQGSLKQPATPGSQRHCDCVACIGVPGPPVTGGPPAGGVGGGTMMR